VYGKSADGIGTAPRLADGAVSSFVAAGAPNDLGVNAIEGDGENVDGLGVAEEKGLGAEALIGGKAALLVDCLMSSFLISPPPKGLGADVLIGGKAAVEGKSVFVAVNELKGVGAAVVVTGKPNPDDGSDFFAPNELNGVGLAEDTEGTPNVGLGATEVKGFGADALIGGKAAPGEDFFSFVPTSFVAVETPKGFGAEALIGGNAATEEVVGDAKEKGLGAAALRGKEAVDDDALLVSSFLGIPKGLGADLDMGGNAATLEVGFSSIFVVSSLVELGAAKVKPPVNEPDVWPLALAAVAG
jgi:hypothetical protein